MREEVARANLGPFHILWAWSGRPAERTPIDWQVQADAAIDLFLANGYIVLVNGVQVSDLETKIDLSGTRRCGSSGSLHSPAPEVAEPSGVPELTLPQHRDRARAAVDHAIRAVRLGRVWTGVNRVPEVAALHALAPEMQRSVAIDLLARAVGDSPEEPVSSSKGAMDIESAVSGIYATFAGRAIPYTRGDAEILLELAVAAIRRSRRNGMEWMALELVPQPIAAIERTVRKDGLGDLEVSIQEAAELLGLLQHYDRTKAERYRSRLMALLQTDDGPLDPETFDDGDSWGTAWREKVEEVPAALRPLVAQLALGGGAVTPPLKWQTHVRQLLATPGATDLLRALLLDVETTRLRDVPIEWSYIYSDPSQMPVPRLRDRNALVIRGTISAVALSDAPWKAERLAELGVTFGTSGRTNNVARDERIANTCAAALGMLDDAASFAALGLMKVRVSNRNVSKQIARALETAAARRGMSPSELLELSIPTMGLDASGRREETIGDELAVLAIDTDGEVTLTWRDRTASTARAHPRCSSTPTRRRCAGSRTN